MKNFSIGYVPYSKDFSHPADRRRLLSFAKNREINIEVAEYSKKYDRLVLSERANLSHWINYKHCPITLDLCDPYLFLDRISFKNIFHGLPAYFNKKTNYPYFSLVNYFINIIEKCESVVCSSFNQLEMIYKYNKNVYNINDYFFDEIKFQKNKKNLKLKKIRILWEGLGVTSHNIKILHLVLKKINNYFDTTLVVVSDKSFYKFMNQYFKIDTKSYLNKIYHKIEFHEWSIDKINNMSKTCDLAIIPIEYNKMNWQKNSNKLLLFWQLGIPAITTNTPAYKLEMQKANINLFCSNDEEWVEKIIYLTQNPEFRNEIINLGLNYVQRKYNLTNFIYKWNSALNIYE